MNLLYLNQVRSLSCSILEGHRFPERAISSTAYFESGFM